MLNQAQRDTVINCISQMTGIQPSQIKPESVLDDVHDLGFDELDRVEVMMSLEDEFDIELDDSIWDQCKTVEDLMGMVEMGLAQRFPAGACVPA